MTSHRSPRNINNRINTRSEKYRNSCNYQAGGSPKIGDYRQDFAFGENRYESQSYNQLDCTDDNEYKENEDRSSNESISLCDTSGNPNGIGDIDRHYRDYAENIKREKVIQELNYSSHPNSKRTPNFAQDNYDDIAFRSQSQRKAQNYSDKKAYETVKDPHTAIAAKKLEKLRELQYRRDYIDKYYNQEIKRLLTGDQYYENAKKPPSSPPDLQQERIFQSRSFAGDQTSYTAPEHLEPCGTMTIITRLDCGCAEQMTRPIFTTPSGRVQKRNCDRDQEVHMRMSTPNAQLVFTHQETQSKQRPTATAGTTTPTTSKATPAVPPTSNKLKSKSFANQRTSNKTSFDKKQETVTKRTNQPARNNSESSINTFSA